MPNTVLWLVAELFAVTRRSADGGWMMGVKKAQAKQGSRFICCIGFLSGLVCGATDAAEHQVGELLVKVNADQTSDSGRPNYQITVEDAELVLAKLIAPFEGTLSNSFVADLNRDGQFEIIVTFSANDGLDTGLHVYSWSEGYLLKPHKVTALTEAQRSGYRGGDQFAVRDNELLRIYQVYENTDGQWQPTAEQRKFRYQLSEAIWVEE